MRLIILKFAENDFCIIRQVFYAVICSLCKLRPSCILESKTDREAVQVDLQQEKERCSGEGAESLAMRRLKVIFENEKDLKKADVWKEFFLSQEFLREQYSEDFVNGMIQYLSDWQKQGDGWELCLPAGFLTELAIAYALRPEQGQSDIDVSNTFPAREAIAKRWQIEMDQMAYPPIHTLNKPDRVVRMRAFRDYLQLRHMNAESRISPADREVWSNIVRNGQARCLYEQNIGAVYLCEEYRGECLIALFTFWIQNERVPKCVLECMYQEYNLKNVEHSLNRKLYASLKQEILRQYPDIESVLYGDGARAQKIADCFRELAKIVSDNHSDYDKNIYEETNEIKGRIQAWLASSRWQELQYDMDLFDKIFSQIHSRHVMPVSLSKALIAFYSQKARWGAEDRARQMILEGLIPSLGFNRRIKEIEGMPAVPDKTGEEDIWENDPDFWQYYLTWGFGLRNACEEDVKRSHKYDQDEREYLPAYMERTYYPSLVWQKRFTRFDGTTGEISSPVSMEWNLPDKRTLGVEFHLHYVCCRIDGRPVYRSEYTFAELINFSALLERPELFFFLLSITSIEKNECDSAVPVVEQWLQKTPLYPQTVPDIARLLVERCRRRHEENRKICAVYYMEQESFCVRAVVSKKKVDFYVLGDFVWQKFHQMAAADDGCGEQTVQAVMDFLQALKQPLPVSLGAVSLEGMEPKEKAKQIIEALKRHEQCSSFLTETYCVLRYGVQKKSERVLYCAMNPFGEDLTQRNEQIARQYAFSCQELGRKVKERHRIVGFLGWGDFYTPKEICDPKPFAVGESGTYYYYQSIRMRRGDSLAAILPEMFDLTNVTEVESFRGHLSISRIDGRLEYCYGDRELWESVHALEKTGADFLSVFTEAGIRMALASWIDELLAVHEKGVQWIHFVFRYQADEVCVLEMVNRIKCYDAGAFAEEQLSAEEVFVWKSVCRQTDVFRRLKDMLLWYLDNGIYGCRLRSARRMDIACWIEEEQVMEETILIKTEFGIIDDFDETKDYGVYEPERYHCIYIDDDRYINDWWDRLVLMKTYFHCFSRPETGLARWGVTLIPPESLPAFQDIVLSDHRINEDEHLVQLAQLIQKAIQEEKYMIHFGV